MAEKEIGDSPKKGIIRFLPGTSREVGFLFVGAVIGIIFFGNSSTPEASPSPISMPSTASTQSKSPNSVEPIILTQKGDGNSAPFYLVEGSYKVDYVPEASAKDCQPQASLEGIESGDSVELFNLGTQGNGPGTNYVYDVPTGNYFMETSWTFGCEVQVTISQFLN